MACSKAFSSLEKLEESHQKDLEKLKAELENKDELKGLSQPELDSFLGSTPSVQAAVNEWRDKYKEIVRSLKKELEASHVPAAKALAERLDTNTTASWTGELLSKGIDDIRKAMRFDVLWSQYSSKAEPALGDWKPLVDTIKNQSSVEKNITAALTRLAKECVKGKIPCHSTTKKNLESLVYERTGLFRKSKKEQPSVHQLEDVLSAR